MALNNKTALSTVMENSMSTFDRHKLVGWFVLICNVTILALIVYIDHHFIRFATNYSFFSLLNLIAIICTIFALKDQNAAMLYPMLVALVFFIAIPLSLWIICTMSAIYCTFNAHTHHLKDHNEAVLLECTEEERVPLPLNLLLLGLALEKTFEFVLYRRLMKIFEQQSYIDQFPHNIGKGTFNAATDTDDEIVVFEKVAKNGGQSAIYDYGTQRPSA